jgi:acetylglutamate kinase
VSLVVKVGGHALDDLAPDGASVTALADDLAGLVEAGREVALVHGGGPQIAALLAEVGRAGRFVDGLRVTDDATMAYVAMALASVNAALVAGLGRHGLSCVGLTGLDGGLFRARALGAPWGRAAGVPRVDPAVVVAQWSGHYVPVVSPVARDEAGGLLNCNADTAAGALAAALGADLVLLSDVDQLRRDPADPATSLARASAAEVEALIASGAARDGMRPKMRAALDALAGGAGRVVLANGRRPHALAEAVAGSGEHTEVTA